MKSLLISFIIIAFAFACGCALQSTTQAPAAAMDPVTSPVTADLLGNWTGPMQGYDEGRGFSDYPDLKVLINISEQKGRIFTGTIVFVANGTTKISGFAGAIGRDGRSLTIAEKDGGYCTGEIVGTDEIELVYMQDGSPYSIAIDSFRRT